MANKAQKVVFTAVCSVVCRPRTAIKCSSHIIEKVSLKTIFTYLCSSDLVFTEARISVCNCSQVHWTNGRMAFKQSYVILSQVSPCLRNYSFLIEETER